MIKVLKKSNPTERRTIRIGDLEIGAGRCVIIAGPCAVESEEQMVRIAHHMKKAGAHILRGGAFKPRTSPYAFQGLGGEGLKILALARKETGLPVVTEALDVRELDNVAEYSDIIQIGSRNMQNFPLLKEAGKLRRPILLKRGMSATIQEWLAAAEYIAEGGNTDIILCERGVRSFDPQTRNLLDLSCVPVLKDETFLPVAVDPSHATGRRDLIEPMALAALAAGAEAIMIEAHDEPEKALSDGFQALRPEQLQHVIQRLRRLAGALDIVIP